MGTEFSRKLALLRKERRISQRTAAADLNVSQALLSHYENGVREPGLSFVVKVCDYYQISADFLLGRTLDRDGARLNPEDILQSEEPQNVLKGSVLAMLHGKLLSNATDVLFGLLGKLNDKDTINAAAAALGDTVYRLFRHLYRSAGGNESYFATDSDYLGLANADEQIAESAYIHALKKLSEEKAFPNLSPEILSKEYPGGSQGLTQVLNSVDSRVSALKERNF